MAAMRAICEKHRKSLLTQHQVVNAVSVIANHVACNLAADDQFGRDLSVVKRLATVRKLPDAAERFEKAIEALRTRTRVRPVIARRAVELFGSSDSSYPYRRQQQYM
ncbi:MULTISPECIES: hypothetical protein [unclassified Caballeronia]|uniref:hypothetical protein n=1 Tax=unclassified Caballeronia TaxID=2646786 RepID=UPI002857EC20|nr:MULTISPECIES: hypothetical protein [unclassified Caballeronia]MDR5741123.1 hypothetical protein [Caballeronia sp. LZ016]MDR5807023.1 hypothetical protein [Caballeronia sp. LZ019]